MILDLAADSEWRIQVLDPRDGLFAADISQSTI